MNFQHDPTCSGLIADFESMKSKFKHSVFIYFHNGSNAMEEIDKIKAELDQVIRDENLGVFGFHEVAVDDTHGSLSMYGYNAEELFKGVLPVLKRAAFLKGGSALLRFGEQDCNMREIELDLDNC